MDNRMMEFDLFRCVVRLRPVYLLMARGLQSGDQIVSLLLRQMLLYNKPIAVIVLPENSPRIRANAG